MKNEREIKSEVAALRDRVKTLSGFWIGEGAAAIYALEWALGKHEADPARELGKSGGGNERIAALAPNQFRDFGCAPALEG